MRTPEIVHVAMVLPWSQIERILRMSSCMHTSWWDRRFIQTKYTRKVLLKFEVLMSDKEDLFLIPSDMTDPDFYNLVLLMVLYGSFNVLSLK